MSDVATDPKEGPRGWTDADLQQLKRFLKDEVVAGRFKPQPGLPFN